MPLKRRVPSSHFVDRPRSPKVTGELGHGPPTVRGAIKQSVIRRGIQGVRAVSSEEAVKPVAVQHPCLVQGGLMRRAVVLRAKHEMRRHCRVQPQSVGLGDLQSRRQIGHLGILPTKHPAIVGHNDVAVVHPHEVVLVGMGSARRGSALPVKLAIPSLSPVQCAPQVDATHKHVTGIGGIHFQAQIPERLSQIV